MANRLESPGQTSFESPGGIATVRGAATGVAWFIGIAEWGKIGEVIECVSPDDFTRKCGGFLNGYYLAKCVDQFFAEGGSKVMIVRTAHYTAGVLDAALASVTVEGFDEDVEDQVKVDTLKFEAACEGTRGNKLNVTNLRSETTVNGVISTGAAITATLTDASEFEVGDVIEMDDGTHYVRMIITAIAANVIYFKSIIFVVGIADLAPVKTASRHAVRTTLAEDLVTDATNVNLTSVAGVVVGSLLSIIDTQIGAPNVVNLIVTDISGKKITFADVGTITTIAIANSAVVSQEFHVDILLDEVKQEKRYEFCSMVNANLKFFVEEVMAPSQLINVTDQNSTEGDIGDLPVVFDEEFLTGGADGLTGLVESDFIGVKANKTGIYTYDTIADMFAQFSSPDMRSVAMQNAMDAYAEDRKLWVEFDIDFDKTPEEAKEYVTQTASLNTNYGEISYPPVKWLNNVDSVTEIIPASGAVAGLNAKVWSTLGLGPWIAAAGVENGKFRTVQGFENLTTEDVNVRNLLYGARINALYKYPQFGNVKYGIQTLEVNGQFPQVPERVVFLFVAHSLIAGTPWTVFRNIDTASLLRLKRTVRKFLRGIWNQGGLKGLTEAEAFEIDVSFENVNTQDRQDAGEMWCKVGLATKKAAEFVYFEFSKKITE